MGSPRCTGAWTWAGQGTHQMKRLQEATNFTDDSDFFKVIKTKVKGSRKPPCTKWVRIKWKMCLSESRRAMYHTSENKAMTRKLRNRERSNFQLQKELKSGYNKTVRNIKQKTWALFTTSPMWRIRVCQINLPGSASETRRRTFWYSIQ